MNTDTYIPTKQLTCKECKTVVTVDTSWTLSICRQCQAGVTTPKLRRCARCGFHRPDWHTKAAYCPQCWREYQRERRQRQKAEGQRQWKVKTCSQCGVTEEMPPDNAWCRECRNAYQRAWKREHPDSYELPPQPPQPVTGREPMRTCAGCKRSRPYNRKEFKRASICRRCWQGYQRKADENERDKYAEWRATGAMIECRKCGETKRYERGWDARLCPQCQAERAKRLYEEVKASPARLKHRKEQQESARRRRQAKAIQKAGNQGVSRSNVQSDAMTPETPQNTPQGGKAGIPDSSPSPVDIADAKERAAISERVRKRLAERGIAPLTGRVVVSR